ncbi:MAG: DNA gyrase inhibitor YacG [Pseudomonadota bacterium]
MSAATAERACPICGRSGAAEHRPFCSKRCADVDLHRWLSESYSTPALELDDPDAEDFDPR